VVRLARIDHDHRQAGQGGHHAALVAARGFQHDADWLERAEVGAQPAQAAASARHRPGRFRGMHGHRQALLGHIDSDRDVRWRGHSVPSGCADLAPRLADPGSS